VVPSGCFVCFSDFFPIDKPCAPIIVAHVALTPLHKYETWQRKNAAAKTLTRKKNKCALQTCGCFFLFFIRLLALHDHFCFLGASQSEKKSATQLELDKGVFAELFFLTAMLSDRTLWPAPRGCVKRISMRILHWRSRKGGVVVSGESDPPDSKVHCWVSSKASALQRAGAALVHDQLHFFLIHISLVTKKHLLYMWFWQLGGANSDHPIPTISLKRY